jgi:hypothetical protein
MRNPTKSEMDRIEYKDLYPTEVQRMYCRGCATYLDLTYRDFARVVSGISIVVHSLPTLACPNCGSTYLPDRSRFGILRSFEEAQKRGQSHVQVTRRKITETFAFTKVPFIYDPDDYYYIPGLTREWDRGFLTPVFFNRRVLIKFDHSDEYALRFASRTYGSISTDANMISFGINPNNKAVFWLGDIAQLPEAEQYYLRSENVESDHRIGSEFYDGQIECKFTDSSDEDAVVAARSAFLEAAKRHFRIPLSHLDEETLDALKDFYPPTAFTDREQQRLSTLINQVCVESLDAKALKQLLSDRGIDSENLRSLKRLERLLECEFPGSGIPATVTPLFIVYDLRVASAHLTSRARATELVASARERLGLQAQAPFAEIYKALLTQLAGAFQSLSGRLSRDQ